MTRKQQIYDVLYRAAKLSFSTLFHDHPEKYYYAALILMDSQYPCITAMSEEVLERLVHEHTDNRDAYADYKWSYGDSPYTGFSHKSLFHESDKLFAQDVLNPELDDETYSHRISDWLKAMKKVMLTLSEEGMFADYPELFRNSEAFPPEGDYNWKNAKKLNSISVYKNWLKDNPMGDEISAENEWYEIYHPKQCKVVLVKPLLSKTLAVSLRKNFASDMNLTDFIKACESLPFEISSEFRYKEALDIVSLHPEYKDILSIIPA